MIWKVNLHQEVRTWLEELSENDPDSASAVEDAMNQLSLEGPMAGRPLVDRIKGSKFHNMKELRPPSRGRTEIRLLFAFDPLREALFVVGGDKSGQWQSWYRKAIPIADRRYAEHLKTLKKEGTDG